MRGSTSCGLIVATARRKPAANKCPPANKAAAEAMMPATKRLSCCNLIPCTVAKPPMVNTIIVAEATDGEVIGWVHVSRNELLESEARAEVNGLVVADGRRSLGAGAKLLEAAESWARKHGCRDMNVRSNVIRKRAHAFYLRQGYEHYKTQKAFRKSL